MADEKISDLPAASTINNTDLATIVQSGTNKKSTWLVIRNYVQAAFDLLYVPLSRALTIGGTAKNLLLDRSWTSSEILDGVGSEAQGDILYRGASTWALLSASTDGKQLTTHGAGSNPTWETGTV